MRIGWAMMMRRVEAVIMRGEGGNQLYSYSGKRQDGTIIAGDAV